MNLDGCNALITGASAGIGREFALHLASRANTIVLVARREHRLLALKEELVKRRPEIQVQVRAVDLAAREQFDELLVWLNQNQPAVDLLINNAGLGDMGAFSTSDPERIDRMIQVNISALTLLTRCVLPPMIAKRKGGILNVSSSAGFLPIAQFSVYAASKAYVTSFSEGLRAELRGTGITVSSLCPGPVHTEFTEVARRPDVSERTEGPEFVYVSPEAVARCGLAAIERDRPLVIPGFFMKAGMAIVRMTPMPLLRLGSVFSAKRA